MAKVIASLLLALVLALALMLVGRGRGRSCKMTTWQIKATFKIKVVCKGIYIAFFKSTKSKE
jgi:hypothetical protein